MRWWDRTYTLWVRRLFRLETGLLAKRRGGSLRKLRFFADRTAFEKYLQQGLSEAKSGRLFSGLVSRRPLISSLQTLRNRVVVQGRSAV